MTYAGPIGLPQGGAQIIVRSGEIDLRPASQRSDMRSVGDDVLDLLRDVVAIRRAGKKG